MYESGKTRIIMKIILTLAVPFVSLIYFMLAVFLVTVGINLLWSGF